MTILYWWNIQVTCAVKYTLLCWGRAGPAMPPEMYRRGAGDEGMSRGAANKRHEVLFVRRHIGASEEP